MDIKYLIEHIDTIISYFLPASMFMFTYKLTAHYAKNIKVISVETVLYSFLITAFARKISPSIDIVAICLSCLIAGFLSGLLKNNTSFEKWYRGTFKKVYNDNIWYGITDFEKGCYIKAFLDDKISYYGVFKDDYSDGKNTWIIISEFVKYNGSEVIEDFSVDKTRQVAIDTSRITHVEIKYAKDSHKIFET